MKKILPPGYHFIIVSFLIWRILLFLPVLISDFVLPYRPGDDYTRINKFIAPDSVLTQPFLYPWANFDGVHYLRIAADGYSNNFGFFPLLPSLISFFSLPFGHKLFSVDMFVIGFIITNAAYLLGLIQLYKLLRLDYSPSIAKKTILAMLVFPTSFFFGSIYTESLFFLLSITAFYFARKGRWALTGLFGFVLTLTRLVGIMILPALLFEFWQQNKMKRKNYSLKSFTHAWPILFIPLGIMGYALYNYVETQDSLYFLHAHGALGNGRSTTSLVIPLQTIIRYGKIFLTVSSKQFEFWVALLEFGSFLFASILLYIGWKKKIRGSYLVFTFLCFITPAFSGTFTGLPRYILPLFPLFLSLSLIKNRLILWLYYLTSLLLLFLLLMFFSKGYFIA